MAKKQNPYHLWLGLPKNSATPNYFQLLGVDANDQDQNRISQTARSNAQALLDRLTKIPVKTENEKAIRDKLKTRIVTAHKTLVAPEKRRQYISALAKKQASTSTISSLGTIEPFVPEPPTPQQPASLQSTAQPPAQSTAQPPAQTPAQTPAQQIPPAIPMAVPFQATAPPAVPNPATTSNDPFAGIEADESVRVRPVRARGKRSSVVPIVVTLLVIAVIGGLVSFLTSYKNVFEVLAERENKNVPVAGATTDPAASGAAAATPAKVPADEKEAEEPVAPLKVSDNFKEMKRLQEEKAMKDGAVADGNDKVTIKRRKKVTSKKMPSKNINDVPTEGYSEDFPPAYAGFEMYIDRGPWGSVERAAADQVHVALRNRDVEAARRASQRRQQLIESAKVPALVRAEYQRLADIDNEMIVHIENFVKQVRSAAIEMPGGQDIKVGSLIMALVDANQNAITVRRAGRSELLPYEILPTSIAIAIGEQGSKESVPKWRLAQAADYAVRLDSRSDTQKKLDPLLEQCRSDGYGIECKSIQAAADDARKGNFSTKNPLPDLSQAELDEAMAKFREANGYKNPAFIKPDDGQAILNKLLYEPSEDPQERIARLSEAIAVAARILDFGSLTVAMDELFALAEVNNLKDTLVVPINRLMRTDMSAAQARQFVKTILRILDDYDGPSFDKKASAKLFGNAQTLVEEFQFPELEAMLKALKAGNAGG